MLLTTYPLIRGYWNLQGREEVKGSLRKLNSEDFMSLLWGLPNQGWWRWAELVAQMLEKKCINFGWHIPFRNTQIKMNKMFFGPCTIVIVEEWKTNLMSLAILFHVLCAQHVSDINISIIRSLRLCWWITTSAVLFSVRCVLELCCGWF